MIQTAVGRSLAFVENVGEREGESRKNVASVKDARTIDALRGLARNVNGRGFAARIDPPDEGNLDSIIERLRL